MKKFAKYAGLMLVYVGVLLLTAFYFTGLSNDNVCNLLGFFLIVAGIIGYVLTQKKQSKY
ncbi:MAG: hypothetical protein LKE41_03360 [Prevotella sp.]|jgi:uncharacterized membrane protein HdeD (DUF308 family)|nr:hypothetical protein [Prevotella sp.]MCI2080384.1 hypothetical protein [Prevotella sp.]MCI2102210.1 hypothetical protein [Prevotella sp.]